MGRTFTFSQTGDGIGISSISGDEHGKKIDRHAGEVAVISGDEVEMVKSGLEQSTELNTDSATTITGPKNDTPHM